jgi:hypothetical protein
MSNIALSRDARYQRPWWRRRKTSHKEPQAISVQWIWWQCSRVALMCMLTAGVTAGLKYVWNCLKLKWCTSLTFRGSLAAVFVKPSFGSQHDLHFTCTLLVAYCPCLVNTCDYLWQIAADHSLLCSILLPEEAPFHGIGILQRTPVMSSGAGKYIATLCKSVGRSAVVWLALECETACLMCYE